MNDDNLPGRPKPPWRRDDKAPSAEQAPSQKSSADKFSTDRETDRADLRGLVRALRSSLRDDARKRDAEKDC